MATQGQVLALGGAALAGLGAVLVPDPWGRLTCLGGAALLVAVALRGRRDAPRRLDPLLERGAHEGLFTWSLRDDRTWFSDRWREISGSPAGDNAGADGWLRRIHAQDRERVRAELEALRSGRLEQVESVHRIANGPTGWRWVEFRAIAERDGKGHAVRLAGSISDVTNQRTSEQQLVRQAFQDALTGLPNRQSLLDRITHALSRARRVRAYQFAVLFLDMDGFKLVNDSLGHAAGDQLLIEVSGRLVKVVRPADVVARLGGDEFALLLDGIEGPEVAERVADRILDMLAAPVSLGGKEVTLGASVGIAHGGANYQSAADLLRDADIAMYRAKDEGKGCFRVFDQGMHEAVVSRMEVDRALRQAIRREELLLHYQPIIDLRSGTVRAFEALVRWHDPGTGRLRPPDTFIPVAEETGMIVPIGEWVAQTAARQLSVWRDAFSGRDLSMNVNVSGRQFRQPDLPARLDAIVREFNLDPAWVRVEVTETVMMESGSTAQSVLEALKARGFLLAIDDFGTGYSSLAYLHRFPADSLKIDKGFVRNLSDPQAARIVRTIVDLGRSLGTTVTAEGVEDAAQLAALRQLGVDTAQGYLFARPMPEDAATRLLMEDPTW